MRAKPMKKIQDKCTYYNVPYRVVEPSVLDDVSYKKMSAIAIVDSGFAKAIIGKDERLGDLMAYNNKNKKKPNRKGHKSSHQSNAPKKEEAVKEITYSDAITVGQLAQISS